MSKRRFIHVIALLLVLLTAPAVCAAEPGQVLGDTGSMMQKVEARRKAAHIKDDAFWRSTLAAMTTLDRKDFVPIDQQVNAYQDKPLPIGFDQTISDPFIVAVMTKLLHIQKDHRVLEIGTGSGYQAAVLARLAGEVRTIEIVEALAEQAKITLAGIGADNVLVKAGDGYAGWPEAAPFDAIIVTAGAPYIPQPLLDQLKPGGRMVIPLGKGFWDEELVLVTKDRKGRIRKKSIGPVMFVDFTGKIRPKPLL